MTGIWYNEIDPFAADLLRSQIAAGLIPPGYVDERDIRDVKPSEIANYTQCHFFAGIGGWPHAFRLAGWSEDRPVWSGSCPCQPFSAAGKGGGFDDERHLWPAFFHLISQCNPSTIFGEQVASKDGLNWFDLVHADLEGAGYAVGAADMCAAGVGAPHIRQRLWFVADARGKRHEQVSRGVGETDAPTGQGRGGQLEYSSAACSMANAGREGRRQVGADAGGGCKGSGTEGLGERSLHGSHWGNVEWLPCRDGKARPTQPGIFPLAHGVPNRVGTLRGAGNAIVPQVAAEMIRSFMDTQT